MKFLKNLFGKEAYEAKGYSLRFDLQNNMWQVLKDYSIMYIGDETTCRKYLSTI